MATAIDAVLEVEHISKSFAGVTVLDDICLTIGQGEVVGLIGENGCGKSTFIKVLSGFHDPDEGAVVRTGGREISKHLNQGPEVTGLGFIHQDLALVSNMSIIENLRIAQFSTGLAGRIRWAEERRIVTEMIARVGLTVDPRTAVGDLSVTERALVAIARGLAEIEAGGGLAATLLVLDEPTAYLPADGVKRLFEAVKLLTREGTSVLFVSHRLDEVLDYCDRVVVFRGGKLVHETPADGRSERDLVTQMLGRAPEDLYPPPNTTIGDVVLEVEELAGRHLRGVSFSGRAGEVIGFMGLPGGGYDEIPAILSGAKPGVAGTLRVNGGTSDATKLTVQRAISNGIAYLPADRKGHSGAQTLSLAENVTIATLQQLTRFGIKLDHQRERAAVREQVERFGVVTPKYDAPLEQLSGGNQQKALLAKWVMADPEVFVLHEPTQGVDVGAKRDVFKHLNTLAKNGSLLLISSVEYEDLANLCTRVHIVKEGKIVQTITGGELTAHELAVAVHER